MTKLNIVILGSLLFATAAAGFAQAPHTLETIEGTETVLGYRLSPDARAVFDSSGQVLIRLPARQTQAEPELMGMLQQGSGIELFLRWWDKDPETGGARCAVFRGDRGSEALLIHDFTIDGAFSWIRFFQPPDARDNLEVLLDVNVGTLMITTYLLAPDRQSMKEMFSTTGVNHEFMDLDGDGVYELVAWDLSRNPRCDFGYYHGDFPVPEIFVRDGAGYQPIWPGTGDAKIDSAFFADLRGDGTVELVALQDGISQTSAQTLAVYRLDNKSIQLVAQTPLPRGRIAFSVAANNGKAGGKEILVRAAAPGECKIGGDRETTGTAKVYILDGDRVREVQP
jgi:hypothetical protein